MPVFVMLVFATIGLFGATFARSARLLVVTTPPWGLNEEFYEGFVPKGRADILQLLKRGGALLLVLAYLLSRAQLQFGYPLDICTPIFRPFCY